LAGLLGALLSTNQPAALSNLVTQTTGMNLALPNPDDPADKELKKIEEDDDAALAEVDKWIKENIAFSNAGAGIERAQLNDRIRSRVAPVIKEYTDFLARHPDHARGHLAYGAFLNDTQDEDGAKVEFEKATNLDPKMSAAWNNLANYYTEAGPVKKAFEYYEKASSLSPLEPLYYRNLANSVALFRKDAREYYNLEEPQVFNKALELFGKAMKLDPGNFELATELAQTYYSIKPPRTDEALNAWTNALKIAPTELQREGVIVHLARFKLNAERFAEARQDLTVVTNADLQDLKTRLIRNLDFREKAKATNAPAAAGK
jgi:tetratricopeptide (TPR) repeat protein